MDPSIPSHILRELEEIRAAIQSLGSSPLIQIATTTATTLIATVVGFLLAYVSGRRRERQQRRSQAYEGVITWLYRLAYTPPTLWQDTIREYSAAIGKLIATWHAVESGDEPPVLRWWLSQFGAIVRARNEVNGLTAPGKVDPIVTAVRQSLTRWRDGKLKLHAGQFIAMNPTPETQEQHQPGPAPPAV